VQPLWRSVWRFLKKLKIDQPYDPAISLMDAYLKDCKSTYNTCIPMLIAALFTIAKPWNSPGASQQRN
jgi:hypothetical protein